MNLLALMQRKTIPEPPLAFGAMPDGSMDPLLQFIDGAGTSCSGLVFACIAVLDGV